MSKIEEMAEKYASGRLESSTAYFGFRDGANAVLKEIEKYANMQDGCYALECIQMKINELKGE